MVRNLNDKFEFGDSWLKYGEKDLICMVDGKIDCFISVYKSLLVNENFDI